MLAAGETAQLNHLMGDIAVRAGDRKLAAIGYQLAARREPTEEHLFDWGDNLLHLGARNDAADVFAAAVRRHPTSARLNVGLGVAQYARGQYEDALRAFVRATDIDPKDPNAYGFLGEMYGVVPDPEGQIVARMARFVELQPQSAPAHFFYAMNLRQRGGDVDLARVEVLLRKAVSLDGTHAKARLQLGILLSEQRRWKEAIAELETAVRLAPEAAQPHFRLAHAYRRDGQTARADEELAIFERLKASDPAAGRPE
jgi:tetratricopeptide (TPR) repeat protein